MNEDNYKYGKVNKKHEYNNYIKEDKKEDNYKNKDLIDD